MQDISKPAGATKGYIATAVHFAAVAVLPAFLAGCMGLGDDLASFNGADKKLTTSALHNNYTASSDTVSDETTVRNAVSSADISKAGQLSIPWANTSTGSAGVINTIREENNGSYVCRNFTTTRHSYRGISNFEGKTCLVGSGEWQLITFKEVG